MEDISLFAKTFGILSIQLFITFVSCFCLVGYFRYLYKNGATWIHATTDEKGQVDLHPDPRKTKPYFWLNFVLSILLFVALLFTKDQLLLGMGIFSLWSVSVGVTVGLALIHSDENLGWRILAITANVTLVTGLIGLYSGIDYSFMGKGLLIALILLIIISIIRIFIPITGFLKKLIASFGVVLFTLYLIYDFNKIKLRENTWESAMDISISLYLDIVNLFLQLLDLMT